MRNCSYQNETFRFSLAEGGDRACGPERLRRGMRASLVSLALAACSALPMALAEPARLSSVFQDNMVLQRDQVATIWGTADPGAEVNVELGDQSRKAVAGADGKWSVKFDGASSGRTALTVRQGRKVTSAVENLVWGDVFLCSGQSNMDLPVQNAANASMQYAAAGRFPIYVARVDRVSSPAPLEAVEWYVDWSQASAESIGRISSVCWHMAFDLAGETGEPIAIIHSAWGGTLIEDWMSLRALSATGEADELVALMEAYNADPEAAIAEAVAETDAWAEAYDPGSGAEGAWHAETGPSDDWKPIEFPGQFERAGIEEISNFNGAIWFRKIIELPKGAEKKGAVLSLGKVDERDTVWINGQRVGASIDPSQDRVYDVPAGVLKAGANTITIRVVDERGSGGVRGPERALFLETGGAVLPLSGTWEYRVGVHISSAGPIPQTPWVAPRGATTLYNGMIHPLGPLSLKGVVWYQGESNSGNKPDYSRQLEAMIDDWRVQFANPYLPFVIVQLPNIGLPTASPQPSRLAPIREYQREAAERMDNVITVVTIDRGEPTDIHPSHKLVVGERVADAMRSLAYGQSDVPFSPYPVGIERLSETEVRVDYDDAAGLVSLGGAYAPFFQLCSAEKACRYVDARVEGSDVLLTGASSADVLVRYAWDDGPVVLLFTEDGLPAAPFELEIP